MPVPTLKEAFPGYLPAEKEHLDRSPKIAEQLDEDVKQSLQYIKRGDVSSTHWVHKFGPEFSALTSSIRKFKKVHPILLQWYGIWYEWQLWHDRDFAFQLGVPEHALKAAAYQYAESCDSVNKEFMLCKKEEGDPRKCLKYGDKVSVCAEEFFK